MPVCQRTKVTILFSMLYSLFFYAQSTMNIHQNNGDVLKIPLNTIDSVTYTIFNSDNTPIIQSVSLQQSSTSNGTDVKFNIIVASNAPVDWLNSSFYGPNGNIYGGGSGIQFSETSKGIWEYTRTDFVSKWLPSGEYYYNGISVKNQGELKSNVWSKPVSIKITNLEIAKTPVIKSITLEKVSKTDGTDIKLKIIVESNAPVNWLNSSFYGPSGNLSGGGSGVMFTETSKGIWEYNRTDFVSKWSPSGEYYYSGVSVENEGKLKSTVWTGSLKTSIMN